MRFVYILLALLVNHSLYSQEDDFYFNLDIERLKDHLRLKESTFRQLGHLDSLLINRFRLENQVMKHLFDEIAVVPELLEVGYFSGLEELCYNRQASLCDEWKKDEVYLGSVSPFDYQISDSEHLSNASFYHDQGYPLDESWEYYMLSKKKFTKQSFQEALLFVNKAISIVESIPEIEKLLNNTISLEAQITSQYYFYKGFILRKMNKGKSNSFFRKSLELRNYGTEARYCDFILGGAKNAPWNGEKWMNAMATASIGENINRFLLSKDQDQALLVCKETFELRSRNIKSVLAFKNLDPLESQKDYHAALGYTYYRIRMDVGCYFPEFVESEEFQELAKSYSVTKSNYPVVF